MSRNSSKRGKPRRNRRNSPASSTGTKNGNSTRRKRAETEVVAVEEAVDAAITEAKQHATRPLRTTRQIARAYLRGHAQRPGELRPAFMMVADADETAALLIGVAATAAGAFERLTNPLAGTFLGQHDELALRLDDAECQAWRAFTARVREPAAED